MRTSPSGFVLRIVLAAAGFAASAFAAEPPPPTEAELMKYVAVQDALATDTARRQEICALFQEGWLDDGGGEDDLAAAGRRAEANPIFGPLLRRQGITGRRYAELSVEIFGVLLGAAIADEADADARRAGRPANNRETLRASSPSAPPILARQEDLTRALGAVRAMCEKDEEDEDHGDEGDPESDDAG